MTDDDLERRLRRMLDRRADQVEPSLSGPRLRRRVTGPETTRHRVRRFAPVAAAVAAVVVIAGGAALLAGGDDTPAPRPVPPGGRTTTSAPPSSSPTAIPPPPPTTARPTAPVRSVVVPTVGTSAPSRLPSNTRPVGSSPTSTPSASTSPNVP